MQAVRPVEVRASDCAIPLLLATIIAGVAWGFYALAWLVVGPEGHASCNCWADYYNDWQYQAQFFVALGGALSFHQRPRACS